MDWLSLGVTAAKWVLSRSSSKESDGGGVDLPPTSGAVPLGALVWLGGIAAVLAGLGYVLRPVAEIVDELHDSDDDSDDDSDEDSDEDSDKPKKDKPENEKEEKREDSRLNWLMRFNPMSFKKD